MNLVEVALALPPFRVYTYRDPRRGEKLPLGAQVVVPLGPRRITGFVVGHPEQAPEGLKKDSDLKAIEDVLEDEPALDPEILELGRWAASYYLAPLGEVLRAALPQGERAAAVRRVRLTEEGKLFLKRDREGRGGLPALGLDQGDRDLLARLGRTPSLGLRGLAGTADERRLERFEEEGWVEVGDEVSGQTGGRRPLWAVPVADAPAPAWKPQQKLRRALYERVLAEPSGLALAALSPRERAGLRALARDGLVRIEARSPESDQAPLERPPELNPHQAAALQALTAALGEGFAAFVLQGVTGSGKTEVYLRLIAEARQRGRGALVLVPEIALTPQLAARFRARFGDDVAVLHSGLPAAQRRAAWRRLRAGEVGIALGARSAVFAPVRQLGVVVVDEEHDPSFKQEDGLRYSGRDLALVRAQKNEAVAVLGSATPSLETFRNVEQGRYQRLLLPTRANPAAAARPLPPVEIIDLRRQPPMADGLFSKPLLQAMQATFAGGRAEHPVPQSPGLLAPGAVPRLRARASLHPVRGGHDLPPGPGPAGLPLLRPGGSRCHACARPATRPSWNAWAPGPNGWRPWCASTSPPRGWPAWTGTAPAAAAGRCWSGCLARCTPGPSTSWSAPRW